MSTSFQVVYTNKKVCFGIKRYKLTSPNGTTLIFSVNSRKRMFNNGDENSDMSAPYMTPEIPPASGNNDAIKRLSFVRYFS